jgi:hypothetical protein
MLPIDAGRSRDQVLAALEREALRRKFGLRDD